MCVAILMVCLLISLHFYPIGFYYFLLLEELLDAGEHLGLIENVLIQFALMVHVHYLMGYVRMATDLF